MTDEQTTDELHVDDEFQQDDVGFAVLEEELEELATNHEIDAETAIRRLGRIIERGDLRAAAELMHSLSDPVVVDLMERIDHSDRAITFRLLPKDRALAVFEALDAPLQSDLIQGLRENQIVHIFEELDPDDRVGLMDELPAHVATRLLRGLPRDEREMTNRILGYPDGSIGRRMTPEFVTARADMTASQALTKIRSRLDEVETIYTVPVIDTQRRLIGVVGLRSLIGAEPDDLVEDLMNDAILAPARWSEERAARLAADERLIVLPIVDEEYRLVGILTVDDALRILEEAETEDVARQGGAEPLRLPYLSTPVRDLVQSRIVWLLVLAIGATLTVQVLQIFEETLESVIVLSLFIPLIIGTGGNTGNQAATTVTRALALGDVNPRDGLRVAAREIRTGFLLGAALGGLAFLIAGLVYGFDIGGVIGLTLLGLCTIAATVGGLMPILARAVKADPAVFSNPFISTFVDAFGLVFYFVVATMMLGL